MNPVWAIILGTIQGLTEFLPISSSGHLVITQKLIPGFSQPGVLFDVVVHLGTLFAVLVFFRKKILSLKKQYIFLLLAGTVPVALIGFFFATPIESLFENVRLVGFALLLTGFVNLLTDKANGKTKEISFSNSFFIGLAQAVAIIPGISRSGTTIVFVFINNV